MWALATQTPKGGTSAGVCFLCREYVDAHCLTPSAGVIVEGRLLVVKCRLRICGDTAVYSAYLHSGEGPSQTNRS